MEEKLIEILNESPMMKKVFNILKNQDYDNYYIGAGAVVQTIWNHLTGKAYDYGIEDLDIIYFDEDTTYATEDNHIEKLKELMKDIKIPVDVKNQARVHLWYNEKFNSNIKAYISTEDAVDSWPTTVTSLAINVNRNGYKIYAPFGLEDVFSLTLRANKKQITEDVYNMKVKKWTKKWKELKVIKW